MEWINPVYQETERKLHGSRYNDQERTCGNCPWGSKLCCHSLKEEEVKKSYLGRSGSSSQESQRWVNLCAIHGQMQELGSQSGMGKRDGSSHGWCLHFMTVAVLKKSEEWY